MEAMGNYHAALNASAYDVNHCEKCATEETLVGGVVKVGDQSAGEIALDEQDVHYQWPEQIPEQIHEPLSDRRGITYKILKANY